MVNIADPPPFGGPNLLYNCRESSTNRPYFLQNEPKFRKSQMNVNKVLTMNYEKKDTWWTGKKRTQTNPNKPNSPEPKMSVNVSLTRNYENNPALPLRQNKPNSNPIPRKRKMNASSLLTRDYENQPLRGIKPMSKQLTHQFRRSRIALTQIRLSEIITVSIFNRSFFGLNHWKGQNCEKLSRAVQK